MLKQHKFWACVMIIAACMCILTGHKMTAPKKEEE